MKKTLIASAIAAATFSGSVFAQSEMSASELAAKMDSMPSVYGNIQYVLTHTNVDGAGSTVEHADNGSTLGVKHDHEIAPGITGFFKLELEGINADDKSSSNGIDALDEAYIGVKGDSFGQVWVGSDDSVYESAIVKIGNFHEVGSDIFGNYSTGEGDLVQYMSPSFGGLTVAAAVQVNGDNDTKGGADKSYPYQLVATYAVDALEVSFGMDSNDGGAAADNNENSYGLTATYSAGDFSVIGEYQTRKDVNDIVGVMGVYTMGANQFALSYQMLDDDASGDKKDTVILQALHNVSDHMYVYFEGYLSGADAANEYSLEGASGDEQSIAALGAVYYF
ncbi:porin [Marinobacter adhaerens]|jgi:predicted porin|uniref:Porin n=2 Tax=Marinobacter adhaerens TaxID=1033846 RepID=A0ABX8INC1_9GAMM|nr:MULTISPECIES: porin [Marinobacter]ADP96196.1 outer membrane protein (porin) [Marinobacter adhaerens HP15]MBW3228399.1 porin [Marinobacter adhaerens]MBW4980151.1 porin [Marinobacter adhaerens]QWV14201.1 porin [Marinobacter adhaerens]ROQ38891.1 putative porin [Marinobacter sp. 3-2]